MIYYRSLSWFCMCVVAVSLAYGQADSRSVRVKNTFKNTSNGYEWKIFLNEDQKVLSTIQCVEYRLDPTLDNPIRKSCDSSGGFAISGTSWNEFAIVLRITWKDNRSTVQSYDLELHQLPSVTLKNTFIAEYKDRATIEVNFIVDAVGVIHPSRTGGSDGDGVAAGSAIEVGLPIVVEIMNAKRETEAFKQLKMLAGQEKSIKMAGAWRIWWEHPGSAQVQGETFPRAINSNPDHIFEIHPVTKLEGKSLTETLAPIPSYTPHSAATAFASFERNRCTITADSAVTKIVAYKTSYNYVEFILKLVDSPKDVVDGTIVLADIEDLDRRVVVQRKRMIFVADTEPERRVKKLGTGDLLHVVGVPRLDLSAISQLSSGNTVAAQLPYEMIVVAVID